MEIVAAFLPEVKLVIPKVFSDARGFFLETYRADTFKASGILDVFVQANQSVSFQGTLRGLHCQVPPRAQAKLVRCTRGAVFDVAVDIRRESPTFGQWVGEILSEENKRQLYVPSDFAHGFYVMSETAELQYQCSDVYSPEHERTIRYDDPQFGIEWPFVEGVSLNLSDRDRAAGFFVS